MTVTREELEKMKVPELIVLFNQMSGKNIKSFKKKAIGIDRILDFQSRQLEEIADQIITPKKKVANNKHSAFIKEHEKLMNAEFAKLQKFINKCEDAGVDPTIRQASKFRNGKGLAYSRS